MYTLVRSPEFEAWFDTPRDLRAKAQIASCLDNATLGNFGDSKPVVEGISEMRIHVGAGYRIYYVRTGSTIYVVLTGGDKSSQDQDIKRAKQMARKLKGDQR